MKDRCDVCGFAIDYAHDFHAPWYKWVRELRNDWQSLKDALNEYAERTERLEQRPESAQELARRHGFPEPSPERQRANFDEQTSGSGQQVTQSTEARLSCSVVPGRQPEEPGINPPMYDLRESLETVKTHRDLFLEELNTRRHQVSELTDRAEIAEKERDELRENLAQSRACVDGLFDKLAAAEHERDGMRAIMKTAAVEISELKAKLGGP